MPLKRGKSKEAFKHNVEAEMHAGKPQKQALAIAYSMKRKGKKMAEGGEVPDLDEHMAEEHEEHGTSKEHFLSAEEDMEPVFHSEPMSDDDELQEHDASVHVGDIVKKIRKKRME